MITSQDKALLSSLIKKYASKLPTENLIAFIADNNGMLDSCKLLIKKNNEDDREAMGWVDEQCYGRQVDVRNFIYEISQILSIFQPEPITDNNYDILGLKSDATKKEIKHAYKKLSLLYHPDTAFSEESSSSDTFIKITKAYHALMDVNRAEQDFAVHSVRSPGSWRQQSKDTGRKEFKKKNIFWFSVLAIAMIIVSLLAANRYRKRAMLAGLQNSRAAFIPPSPAEPEENVETDRIKVEPETFVNDPSPKTNVMQVQPEESIVVEKKFSSKTIVAEKSIESVVADHISVVVTTPVQQVSPNRIIVRKKKEKSGIAVKSETVIEQAVRPVIIKTSDDKEEPHTPQIISEPKKQEGVLLPRKEIQPGIQERIDNFLTAYIKAYESKGFLAFARFFDLNATENGKPLAEVMPTYIKLFDDANAITLTVKVLKWYQENEGINIDGRFTIRIRYKNTDQISGNGKIMFLLVDVKQHFLIKELRYQFDKN